MTRRHRNPESLESPSGYQLERVLGRHFPEQAQQQAELLTQDIEGVYRQVRVTLGEVLVDCDDRTPELLDRISLDVAATICEAYQRGVATGNAQSQTEQFSSILDTDIHNL